jgi:hypothetical protein
MKLAKILITLMLTFSVFMSRYLNPVVDSQLHKNDMFAYLSNSDTELNTSISEKSRLLINLSFNAFIATYKFYPHSKSPDKQGTMTTSDSYNSNSYRID